MAPLEPWEKVLVDVEAFLPTVHGSIPCTDCHAGNATAQDKESAHIDLIVRPSEDAEKVCGTCHTDVVETYATSLHATQAGYWTDMMARGVDHEDPVIQQMFGNHCASCHATCGDCHVSQPKSVEGGFIDGHVFQEKPSLTRNCTACHGSRVGNEYMGKNEGVMADVHFREGRLSCTSCHGEQEMHNTLNECTECHATTDGIDLTSAHRYAGPEQPSCTSCHREVVNGEDGVSMHQMHADDFECQVCHSVSYTSCDGCHVAVSETTGKPFFSTEGSYMTFYIGKNPDPNYHRPYQYVLVRHVPVAEDSYAYYGDNLQPEFGNTPTWVMTTPHNIQLDTPQNASCTSCHGNEDLFLTEDKVNPDELEQNLPVIVDTIPSLDLVGGSE